MDENILHAELIAVPCSIGDHVWGIKRFNGNNYRIVESTVHEMYFGDDMSVCICVKGVCRGKWMEKVFPSHAAALKALKEGKEK